MLEFTMPLAYASIWLPNQHRETQGACKYMSEWMSAFSNVCYGFRLHVCASYYLLCFTKVSVAHV